MKGIRCYVALLTIGFIVESNVAIIKKEHNQK